MAVRELTVFSPVISVFSTGEEGIEALPNEILILIAKQFADAHSRETAETLRTLCNMRLVNCRWARVLSVDLVARLAIEAKGLPHCRNPLELIPGPPPNLFEELVRDFYIALSGFPDMFPGYIIDRQPLQAHQQTLRMIMEMEKMGRDQLRTKISRSRKRVDLDAMQRTFLNMHDHLLAESKYTKEMEAARLEKSIEIFNSAHIQTAFISIIFTLPTVLFTPSRDSYAGSVYLCAMVLTPLIFFMGAPGLALYDNRRAARISHAQKDQQKDIRLRQCYKVIAEQFKYLATLCSARHFFDFNPDAPDSTLLIQFRAINLLLKAAQIKVNWADEIFEWYLFDPSEMRLDIAGRWCKNNALFETAALMSMHPIEVPDKLEPTKDNVKD